MNDQEVKKEDEEYYEKQRKEVNSSVLHESTKFGKSILWLSSGAIVLSISFMQTVDDVHCTKFIVISWALLLLSIVATVSEPLVVIKGEHTMFNSVVKQYKKGFFPSGFVPEGNLEKISWFLYIFAIITFIIGLALLVIFAYLNII